VKAENSINFASGFIAKELLSLQFQLLSLLIDCYLLR